MKKAERLLDLIAYLLDQRDPIPFEQIQRAFPEDYGEGSDESIARKFERDKTDILALGLPLKLKVGEEDEKTGYFIERRSYNLQPIDLAPDELAMLYLVGAAALEQGASPFERDLVLALNKIAFAANPPPTDGRMSALPARPARSVPTAARPPGTGLRLRSHLESLRQAVADRKTVTLTYHSLWRDEVTDRKLDPYGLVYQRGVWMVVGHCHLRSGIRVFHVERIRAMAVNPLRPRSPDFEPPPDFDLRAHVAAEPWQIRIHPPVTAIVRFEPPVARSVQAELGPLAVRVEEDGEARTLHLQATYLDGLLPTVLWHRDRARVLEPVELRDKVRRALERLAGEHAP